MNITDVGHLTYTDLQKEELKKKVEQTYNAPVAAVFPHSNEMMTLASAGIFVLRYPDHPVSTALRQIAEVLVK